MSNQQFVMLCEVEAGGTPSTETCMTTVYQPVSYNYLFPPLDVETGSVLAVAVIAPWALAWIIKRLVLQTH